MIQVLLAAFSSWLLVCSSELVAAVESEDCSEFTFSRCQLDETSVLGSFSHADIAKCQSMCKATFQQGNCNIFTFDQRTSRCTLATQYVDDHIRTCLEVGGTTELNVNHCLSPSHPCNYFHEKECLESSNQVGLIGNVPSARNCQRACTLVPACKYFSYANDNKECRLFDGSEKTCSMSVGPAFPAYENCNRPTPAPTSKDPTTTLPMTSATPIPSQCRTRLYHKSNGKCACGFYLGSSLIFEEAKDQCSEQGARLPEIYSIDENKDIADLKGVWLGGVRLDNGTWIWESTGAPFPYTNWDPEFREPQKCMWMKADSGTWTEEACNLRPRNALCEKLFSC